MAQTHVVYMQSTADGLMESMYIHNIGFRMWHVYVIRMFVATENDYVSIRINTQDVDKRASCYLVK